MAKKLCIDCNEEVGTWRNKHGSYGKAAETKSMFKIMGISEPNLENSEEGDIYCAPCHNKLFCRHAVKIWKYYESTLMPEEFEKLIQSGEDWIPIAKAELSSMKDTQTENSSSSLSKQSPSAPMPTNTIQSDERITTASELARLSQLRHDDFKRHWEKNGTVQFKNDKIAILKRAQGAQVQFIVAYDQLTREGFRLMSIDEGATVDGGAGFSGGISSYYYFQKMDYVR